MARPVVLLNRFALRPVAAMDLYRHQVLRSGKLDQGARGFVANMWVGDSLENHQLHGYRSGGCFICHGDLACERLADGISTENVRRKRFWIAFSVSTHRSAVQNIAKCCISILAPIVLRLHYLDSASIYNDPTLSGVFFVIWTIVEVDFSIISGNIACLKPFMAAFNTSYGGVEEINALSRLDRTGQSALSSVNSMKFGAGSKRKGSRPKGGQIRSQSGTQDKTPQISTPQARDVDTLGNDAEVTHEDAESVGSHGSRQMIIQKEITWNVEYHTPNPVKRGTGANTQYNL